MSQSQVKETALRPASTRNLIASQRASCYPSQAVGESCFNAFFHKSYTLPANGHRHGSFHS